MHNETKFSKQILAGTEDVWTSIFNQYGMTYIAVKFTPKLVYIRFVGTHDEYMKIDLSNI